VSDENRPVFYFDLGSPFAYLAAERVNRLLAEPPVWTPILLGGLFKRLGRSSWADGEGRAAGMREVERRARERGLPVVRWPDPWPGNMLYAMRVATFAAGIGRGPAFALAAFRQAFAGGRDLTRPENVLVAAAACELHPRAVQAAAESRQVKDALRAATEEAADQGVMGVPSVRVGDAVFWGDDRLDEAAAAVSALQRDRAAGGGR
jgi:2-hydroxychromene-2-carboxylate isomerase